MPSQPSTNRLYAVTSDPASNSATVYVVSLGLEAGEQIATAVGTLAVSTYAMARDSSTGRVYYIGSEGGDNAPVYYWDPITGENRLVGTVGPSGRNRAFIKLAQAIDGRLYALEGGTTNLYLLNLDTGVIQTVGEITGGSVPFSSGSGDAAFDPNNPNQLYVTVTSLGRESSFYRLHAADQGIIFDLKVL